jgi:hypothetical protein
MGPYRRGLDEDEMILANATRERAASLSDDALALRAAAPRARRGPACHRDDCGQRARLDALSAFLGDRPFPLADRPTSADCAVLGPIAPTVSGPS